MIKLKDYLKKTLYILIFVAADILIFAFLVTAAYSLTGNNIEKNDNYIEETYQQTITETLTEQTTAPVEKAIEQKSTSLFVNWMIKQIIAIRNNIK